MTVLRITAAATLACACGSAPPPDGCEMLESAGVTIEGAVTLGLDGAERFEPIAAGSELELELGTQGGWMVRPVVRIESAALGAGPGSCVWTESVATIEGTADPVSMTEVPTFRYSDATAISRPLLVLLSFDLEAIDDQEAELAVKVEGPNAASTAAVNVLLVNRE